MLRDPLKILRSPLGIPSPADVGASGGNPEGSSLLTDPKLDRVLRDMVLSEVPLASPSFLRPFVDRLSGFYF